MGLENLIGIAKSKPVGFDLCRKEYLIKEKDWEEIVKVLKELALCNLFLLEEDRFCSYCGNWACNHADNCLMVQAQAILQKLDIDKK